MIVFADQKFSHSPFVFPNNLKRDRSTEDWELGGDTLFSTSTAEWNQAWKLKWEDGVFYLYKYGDDVFKYELLASVRPEKVALAFTADMEPIVMYQYDQQIYYWKPGFSTTEFTGVGPCMATADASYDARANGSYEIYFVYSRNLVLYQRLYSQNFSTEYAITDGGPPLSFGVCEDRRIRLSCYNKPTTNYLVGL